MKTSIQKEIVSDKNLIAFCGLYCGACRSFLNGKCAGCKENNKLTWCKLRQCCIENKYQSCADCNLIEPINCKKCNNFISKTFGIIFNSDRLACIAQIKNVGYEGYAIEMASGKMQTIKRK
jgi:hypothetical protein